MGLEGSEKLPPIERESKAEAERGRSSVAWIPALLAGMAAGTAAQLTGWLLLYADDGFIRALTAILFVETIAFAMGLASARRIGPGALDRVRRRWLLAVVSFSAGVVYSAAWDLTGGFSTSVLSQGLGLALLGALPLFGTGALLGGLSRLRTHPVPVALPAFVGAAGSVLLVGALGTATLRPASLYLLCVMGLSAAALVHGRFVQEEGIG